MELFEGEFLEDSDALKQAQETKSFVVDTTERMGMILDLLPISFLIHQEQSILFANQVAIQEIGLHGEKHVGQHIFDFIAPQDIEKVQQAFKAAFDNQAIQKIPSISIRTQSGEENYYQMILALLPWDGMKCVQIFLQNITDAVLREDKLRLLSITDPLTKAFNRRSFVEHFDELCDDKSAVSSHMMGIMDIDHFKAVNDTYGHETGDIALIHLVKIVTARLESWNSKRNSGQGKGYFARLGGEEFGVILPDVDRAEGMGLMEEIRRLIENNPVVSRTQTFTITVSIGVQSFTSHSGDIDETLRRADTALYEAKNAGRNCIRDADAPINMPLSDARVSRSLKRPAD